MSIRCEGTVNSLGLTLGVHTGKRSKLFMTVGFEAGQILQEVKTDWTRILRLIAALISFFVSAGLYGIGNIMAIGFFTVTIFFIFYFMATAFIESEVMRWHAVEHKLCGLIESGRPVDPEEIREISSYSPACGSVRLCDYMLYSACLTIIFRHPQPSLVWAAVLFLIILALLTKSMYRINFSRWTGMAWFVQKCILTREPTEAMYIEALVCAQEIRQWLDETE